MTHSIRWIRNSSCLGFSAKSCKQWLSQLSPNSHPWPASFWCQRSMLSESMPLLPLLIADSFSSSCIGYNSIWLSSLSSESLQTLDMSSTLVQTTSKARLLSQSRHFGEILLCKTQVRMKRRKTAVLIQKFWQFAYASFAFKDGELASGLRSEQRLNT